MFRFAYCPISQAPDHGVESSPAPHAHWTLYEALQQPMAIARALAFGGEACSRKYGWTCSTARRQLDLMEANERFPTDVDAVAPPFGFVSMFRSNPQHVEKNNPKLFVLSHHRPPITNGFNVKQAA